ncbi:MAG: hypothetical protein P4M13_05265 [Alphaproteobacteria bacterium]|nr:hypothetical protein [Alphaproteobacteria bacterium]
MQNKPEISVEQLSRVSRRNYASMRALQKMYAKDYGVSSLFGKLPNPYIQQISRLEELFGAATPLTPKGNAPTLAADSYPKAPHRSENTRKVRAIVPDAKGPMISG